MDILIAIWIDSALWIKVAIVFGFLAFLLLLYRIKVILDIDIFKNFHFSKYPPFKWVAQDIIEKNTRKRH